MKRRDFINKALKAAGLLATVPVVVSTLKEDVPRKIGQWHHVSIQGDDVYINGRRVDVDPKDFRVGDPYVSDKIATDYHAYWAYQGDMKDVRFYDHVLTPDEIQRVMRGEWLGSEKHVFKLEEVG